MRRSTEQIAPLQKGFSAYSKPRFLMCGSICSRSDKEVSAKLFKLSLMFEAKAGAYHNARSNVFWSKTTWPTDILQTDIVPTVILPTVILPTVILPTVISQAVILQAVI